MKKILTLVSILLLIVIIATNCKKKKNTVVAETPTTGSIEFSFTNKVANQLVQLSTNTSYINKKGNHYSVELLKYYVSNIKLTATDGTIYKLDNYELINEADASSKTFTASGIPNKTYNKIEFYVGVDSAQNHTGLQEGDLDPINSMIWTWNTGYMFYKHEGHFIDSNGVTQPVLFHFGLDENLPTISLPVSAGFEIKGDTKKINLIFDLDKQINNIDFNIDNNHQSVDVADGPWLKAMYGNFKNSFSLGSIQ